MLLAIRLAYGMNITSPSNEGVRQEMQEVCRMPDPAERLEREGWTIASMYVVSVLSRCCKSPLSQPAMVSQMVTCRKLQVAVAKYLRSVETFCPAVHSRLLIYYPSTVVRNSLNCMRLRLALHHASMIAGCNVPVAPPAPGARACIKADSRG